jgi:hypothetical protein
VAGSSFKSSLFIATIGELVLEFSSGSSVCSSTIGEGDKLADSPASSLLICMGCGPGMAGKRHRVRSDSGEALKSIGGRALRGATGVTAVIEKGCAFTPWPARLESALITRENLLFRVFQRKTSIVNCYWRFQNYCERGGVKASGLMPTINWLG